MTRYYTNVASIGNNILYRGVKDGRRVKLKIAYTPTLYLPSKKSTNFTNLEGEYLEPMKFESIREARDFVKRYNEVDNFKIYGNNSYAYAFIADTQKGMVDWDINQLSIAMIDIEVGSENGFPDPYLANEQITAICLRYLSGEVVVWGCGEYDREKDKNTKGELTYVKCEDEYNLCKKFLRYWEENCPDVISGWNIKFFDIPYLVNRLNKILGEDETKKLSPWGFINSRKAIVMNRELTAYEFVGVSTLDYIELYRWYAPSGKSQESYRLDHIASVELGENKLSYDEFDNLHSLYRLDHQKFIEYNIKDVDLVFKLEDKLKLIELGLTLGYDTKCNFEDIFAQTRMWDALIYNYLLDKNIIVPPKEDKTKNSAFEGAYVKEPQVGLHNWVASFDLNSLYPHLMMQYNISPETLIEVKDYTPEMRDVLSKGISVDRLLSKESNLSRLEGVTITPNGQYFTTEKQGFLPRMLEEMYVDRSKFKKLMITAKKEYEVEKDKSKLYDIEKRIARYNNLQLAKKVSLNSAYGALGSQYFRFYDLRMALGVTTAGQLSIRWIENKLNEYLNSLLKTKLDYVIASDTDSIYLNLGPLVDNVYGTGQKNSVSTNIDKQKVIDFMDRVCEDKIQPFIDKSYQELATYVHAYDQKMQMKREALSNKGIWTAKKRYILNVYNNEGVAYNEPQIKVMGLEMVKSSTPAPVREKMRQSINIMMNGTESDIHDFIEQFKQEFKSLPPEEISFPRGMNGLKEYSDSATLYKKGTPIHVKGAILYNHNLKLMGLEKKYPRIQEGEKVKFAYLKQPNPFKDTVVSFPTRLPSEFGLQEYLDYDMQFSKSFLEPIKVILDCMEWSTEKKNSLESFFG
jgi:DNA polymerase elongation subunit (family B)